MNNILITLIERREELIKAIIEHIKISFLALIIALLIAIPLGIYLSYHKKIAEIIIGITAILQTVPSLALLGLLIPFVGIGGVPAVIALVIYALLPILRNTYTGITEVDPVYMLASRAMGMNELQQLIKIQIPLAMPVIMAGIRTATVLIIGTATLASLIGAGGLGSLILLGLDRNNNSLILLGAVPAALLAVLFDFILKKFEKADWKKILVCIFAVMVLFFAGNIGADKMMKKNKLIIAGKLGTESGFGKTSFVFNALKSGEIDIYPEFTGTAVFTFLKENPVSNDAAEVYSQAKKGMAEKFDMIYLSPMKFNDTYALAVPQKFAEENNLMKISDLEKIKDKIKAGFTREFNDREDGYKGLKKLYGFELPDIKEFEPKLRYVAVQNGDINLIDAYSTDSELAKYNLVVLEDNKKLFPPYQGAPLLRKDTLKKYPQLETILGKLQDKITDAEMREMNYEVGVDGKRAEDIAREYLKKNGLIK